MAIKKFVVGSFDEEDNLFTAVKILRKAGFKIFDVFTPYPVHGLDKALGQRESKLHTAGFIYAIIGLCTAFGGIGWILTIDWPQNYGGKPHFALPAWIPIMFECTVLFSAVGMVLTFCFLCQIAPFVKKHHFHKRATDDLFVMPIEANEKTNCADLEQLLIDHGAIETKIEYAETGWWFGTYDKPAPIYTSLSLALILLASCADDLGVKRKQNRVYMPDMAYSRAYETYDDNSNLSKSGIHYNAMPVSGTMARNSYLPFLIKKDSPGSTLNYNLSAKIVNPISNLDPNSAQEAERLYQVYCGICHGQNLNGNGPLYKDGNGPFPAKPATFVGDIKYENMPEGQMFYSVSYGKNLMGSYASQLTTHQRWMIIKFIKEKQKQALKEIANQSKSSTTK